MSKIYPLKVQGTDYLVEVEADQGSTIHCFLILPGLETVVLKAHVNEDLVSIQLLSRSLDTNKVLFAEQFLVQLSKLEIDGEQIFENVCNLNRGYRAGLDKGYLSENYPSGGNLR